MSETGSVPSPPSPSDPPPPPTGSPESPASPPPPAPTPSPTPSAGKGTIRLTIQGNVMTSNMNTPTCKINGYPVPTRYGAQDLEVWAGPNRIELESQWMRTFGQAAMDVDVAPGQVVDVFYAAPASQWAKGKIGHTKQPRYGVWAMFGCLGLIAFIFVLIVVIGLFAS